ncbi:MAG TPA: branched-chain amino acid ABC transporter permease [Verrucomicrobia bacterium]|nr:MAG: ABC transporter permease [Lentisphaerae bacterium GWF2_57_35]HBA82883.1 branched-chain amino acid ABC transporter permease [Verrucomicrobiota bacterium]
MIYFLQQTLNALQLGSIYALIALGYTMVYGILLMINFAHGDLFMVGAFLAFALATFLGWSFVPTLLAAMIALAVLGVVIERLAYKPLRHAPKMSAVITALGVGIFLEHLMLAFNPYPRHMPELMPVHIWTFGQFSISSLQVLIIGLSVSLMVVLDWVVMKTKLGLAMRAISWNIKIVPLMGVPVNRVISATFAMGAALGAAAGTLYSMAYPVIDPYMGVMVGWKAFIAAVIGGIGNIRGAVLGGFILAGVEIGVAAVLPTTFRDFISFGLLLILLVVRPHGLLGKPRVEKI